MNRPNGYAVARYVGAAATIGAMLAALAAMGRHVDGLPPGVYVPGGLVLLAVAALCDIYLVVRRQATISNWIASTHPVFKYAMLVLLAVAVAVVNGPLFFLYAAALVLVGHLLW